MVSHCRTSQSEGGMLQSEKLLEYLKSRLQGEKVKIIIIGKRDALSPLWKSEFLDKPGV